MSDLWRYRLLGEEFGPVTAAAIGELLADGGLSVSDEVCREGANWRKISSVEHQFESHTSDMPAGAAMDGDLAQMLEQIVSEPTPPPTSTREALKRAWFARVFNEELGPLDWDQLSAMAQRGALLPTDEIRQGPDGPWDRAGEVVGLFTEDDRKKGFENGREDSCPQEPRWDLDLGEGRSLQVSYTQLQRMAAEGRLTPRDRIREAGASLWVRAATQPGLFATLEQSRTLAGQVELATQKAGSRGDLPVQSAKQPTSAAAEARGSSTPMPVAAEIANAAKPSKSDVPPRDQWSNFFEKVEERERKIRKRDQSTRNEHVAGAVTSPEPDRPVSPQASPSAADLSAMSSPAGGFTTTSASTKRPAFTPPPRPKRSVQLPSFDLSGLLSRLKGDGEGVSQKTVAGLVVGAVLLGYYLFPSAFGGDPGADYYAKLAPLWQKALQLTEQKADASAWNALKTEALPVMDDIQMELAPVVDSRGKNAPIAQRMLWMVDRDSGPTGGTGFLRKILEAGPTADEKDFISAHYAMSEASSLIPSS